MGGIYLILCSVNGKIYVGSAKNLHKRWGVHKKELNLQKHCNRNLQSAWLKYGEDAFSYTIHEVLGEYDKKFFFERENFWMDTLRAEGKILFNIAQAEGGWGPETFLRKDEITAKISVSLRRHAQSLTLEERKAIYGKGKRGRTLSEEHKRKTSDGLKNRQKSEITKVKMSLAQQNLSAEVKKQKAANMSEVGKQRKGKTPANAKPIIFRGIQYSSAPACKRETGLSMHQILREVYGPDYRKEKETL
jgi:group I intron endonuclease